jgi:hypothetical protein
MIFLNFSQLLKNINFFLEVNSDLFFSKARKFSHIQYLLVNFESKLLVRVIIFTYLNFFKIFLNNYRRNYRWNFHRYIPR